jgi:hypothetical protein
MNDESKLEEFRFEFLKVEYQGCIELGVRMRERLHRLAIGSLVFNGSLVAGLALAIDKFPKSGGNGSLSLEIGVVLLCLSVISIVFNLGAAVTMYYFTNVWDSVIARHRNLHCDILEFLGRQSGREKKYAAGQVADSLPDSLFKVEASISFLGAPLSVRALTGLFYLSIIVSWFICMVYGLSIIRFHVS